MLSTQTTTRSKSSSRSKILGILVATVTILGTGAWAVSVYSNVSKRAETGLQTHSIFLFIVIGAIAVAGIAFAACLFCEWDMGVYHIHIILVGVLCGTIIGSVGTKIILIAMDEHIVESRVEILEEHGYSNIVHDGANKYFYVEKDGKSFNIELSQRDDMIVIVETTRTQARIVLN